MEGPASSLQRCLCWKGLERHVWFHLPQLRRLAIEPWWGLPMQHVHYSHANTVDCCASFPPDSGRPTSGFLSTQKTYQMDALGLRQFKPKGRDKTHISHASAVRPRFGASDCDNIGLRPNLALKPSLSVVGCRNYCCCSTTGNPNFSSSPSLSIRVRQGPRSSIGPHRSAGLWLQKGIHSYSEKQISSSFEEDEDAEKGFAEEDEEQKHLGQITVDFSAMKLLPDFGPNDVHWPPLPAIRDKTIERQIFTHRSFHARPTHVFEDHPDDLSPDNERYEHLGDTVLGLVVTNLMFDMFPGLRVGPSTKIRSLVVGNFTLADISKRYKLPDRLRLHHAQAVTLRASTNIQADLFEAFVGGLFRDQGLPVVQQWLVALFRPFAKVGYDYVRKQHNLPPLPPSPSTLLNLNSSPNGYRGNGNSCDQIGEYCGGPTVGHLALFNQQIQKANRQVEWIYSDGSDPAVDDELALDKGTNTTDTNHFYGHPASGLVCADHELDFPSNQENESTVNSPSPPESPNSPDVNGKWYSDPCVPAHLRIKGTTLTPVWYVKVLVDGEFYGRGRGNTKKAARNEAAKEGLLKLGIEV